MGIKRVRYLDVGANDPMKLSNTYLFYEQGASGVLVEPNPDLVARLARVRPRDKIRACGVGPKASSSAQLFVLSAHTASTFSAKEAEVACKESGAQLARTINVPVVTLESVVREEFGGGGPDFLSLDVEGWDEAIVLDTDWRAVHPAVICIETREHKGDESGRRIGTIADKLLNEGYGLAGQTYYNSIFADRARMHHP
jgi:FkbM family methyltransferase